MLEFIDKEKKHEEQAAAERDEAAAAEIAASIAEAVSTAKLKKRQIKRQMRRIASAEERFDTEYENLQRAICEREEEICSSVRKLCQNYKGILENERKQMHSTFQRELQSGSEAKWFLYNCYKKFNDVLADGETPNKLLVLQLDATVAQIANEHFEAPKWTLPTLETDQTQADLATLKSLVGTLTLERREEPDAWAVEEPDGAEDDEYDAGSDADFVSLADISLADDAQGEGQDAEADASPLDDAHGLAALRLRRRKKRKYVVIGSALLQQAGLAMYPTIVGSLSDTAQEARNGFA